MRSMRILLVLPCCIGDVILATAALRALRRAYPDARIVWAVGAWSKAAVEHHPDLDAVLDCGAAALPMKSPGGMARFVQMLRAERADLLVSWVRSPWMSVAALLSGIPTRAGIDSAGRGFGYTVRAGIDPQAARHEAEIYLDVVRALGIDAAGCLANVPVLDADRQAMRARLKAASISPDYVVVHPGGGRNPGMTLDVKRYPPEHLAALAEQIAERRRADVVLIGAPNDAPLVESVAARLTAPHAALTDLTFGQIAALAAESALYVGNDTGMTHLAAAVGTRTAAIFGPTDPRRYAPFGKAVRVLWRPVEVGALGVAGGAPAAWDWARDGISVEACLTALADWL